MTSNESFTLALGVLALLLSVIAIFPGSLGILAFTHKFTARPAGAYFTYVVAIPLYALSVAMLGVCLYLTAAEGGSWTGAALICAVFAGVSGFGFLMHTGFMFKPVRAPRYISVDEAIARFGPDEEVVGVFDRHAQPWAYVARLARRPHIVYQTEGDAPFVMSHCILSHSSMAYELTERFSPERIFISSVIANNLVFYDRTGHCTVQQIYNSTTDRTQALRCLPTIMTTLALWKEMHPSSKVWVRPREWRDTFYLKLLARASIIDPQSPDLVYPLLRKADERLPLKAYVMGIEREGRAKAYPLELFQSNSMVEDMLGAEPIVFFSTDGGEYVQCFSRKPGSGEILNFEPLGNGRFRETRTSSVWTVSGSCVEGILKGQALKAVPHYNKIFWCVWADFYPGTAIYQSPHSADATQKNATTH